MDTSQTVTHPHAMRWLSRFLRAVVGVILVQTLYFKFTAAPESVYIFTMVGQEPVGRIGSGIAELIAALLLCFPRTVALGAGISFGVICGALFFHLTTLGIEIQGDGGLLFALAVTVWVSSLTLLFLHRKALPFLGSRIK
jgi:putative oxidoreductase